MTRDGTRAFINPVSGKDPIEDSHLSTKAYVDEKTKYTDYYVKNDGSVPFSSQIKGYDPIDEDDLSTKRYVDKQIDIVKDAIEGVSSYFVYKVGKTKVPVNSQDITIKFGRYIRFLRCFYYISQ